MYYSNIKCILIIYLYNIVMMENGQISKFVYVSIFLSGHNSVYSKNINRTQLV